MFIKKTLLFMVSIYSLNASIVSKLEMIKPSFIRTFNVATSTFYKNNVFSNQLDPSTIPPYEFYNNISKWTDKEIRYFIFARHKNYDIKNSDLHFLINNLNTENNAYALMWLLKCSRYVQHDNWNEYCNFNDIVTKNQVYIMDKLQSFNSNNTENIAELLRNNMNSFKPL